MLLTVGKLLNLTADRATVTLRLQRGFHAGGNEVGSHYFVSYSGFDAGLGKLRGHFDWLTSPAGVLRELRFRLADAERELPRALEVGERERIKQDMEQLRAQIAEQERVVADPAAAAAETGARIQT